MKDAPITQAIMDDYILPEKGKNIQLMDHQRLILNLFFTPNDSADIRTLPYRNLIYSAPKKHGKTELSAAIAWAFAKIYGGEIYICANDKEQAQFRLYERILELLEWTEKNDRDRYGEICLMNTKDRIELQFPETGKKATLLPQALDYRGISGARNALCVFDELHGYTSAAAERFWSELQPIPTIRESIRVVTSYAGFAGESNLLYELYATCLEPDVVTGEATRPQLKAAGGLPVYEAPQTLCYWDTNPKRVSWVTDEFLEGVKGDPAVSDAEMRRLWYNQWVTGQNAFITPADLDKSAEEGVAAGLYNRMEELV